MAPRKSAVKELQKVRACNCTALRKATRRVTLVYDRYLAPSGLTAGQYAILDEIAGFPESEPPTLSALAQSLAMDRTALSHTLKPLERDGLIRFVRDRHDRRAWFIRLTAPGRSRAAKARKGWMQAQAHFLEVFGTGQTIALQKLLRILTASDFGDLRSS
jgi:DNA-binding MarR family transcriptional regulator